MSKENLMEEVTYAEFKTACSEFFKATVDRTAMTISQAENGQKMINIMWVNRTEWSELDLHQSMILLEMVNKRVVEIQIIQV